MFCSGERGRKGYTAGVALTMHNSFLQYIEDTEPMTDILMHITLRGTLPTTIIATYMPASDRPYEEKHNALKRYRNRIDRKGTKDHSTC